MTSLSLRIVHVSIIVSIFFLISNFRQQTSLHSLFSIKVTYKLSFNSLKHSTCSLQISISFLPSVFYADYFQSSHNLLYLFQHFYYKFYKICQRNCECVYFSTIHSNPSFFCYFRAFCERLDDNFFRIRDTVFILFFVAAYIQV